MTMRAFIGFAGFGGPEIALKEYNAHVIGVELDDDIAQVARDNGHNTITADLLDIDSRCYTGYDLMHFSPPCPSFSVANSARGETAEDIVLGRKIADFIKISRPRFVTLENVWLYRRSYSWKRVIKPALRDAGYAFDFWLLNAADYGVPQTRKRMIVAARLDGEPVAKPFPTHSKYGDMFTLPWVGWHEAICDLIPSLPDSEFAPWQLKRMPAELKARSLLIPGDNAGNTTVCNGNEPKGLLVEGQNNRKDGSVNTKLWNEPAMTLTAGNKGVTRAFIVGDQRRQTASAEKPVFTVRAGENGGAPPRALVDTRVVSMTPEALARFQGFPRDYKLPGHNGLSRRGIGNALPPAVMGAVLKMLIGEPNEQHSF